MWATEVYVRDQLFHIPYGQKKNVYTLAENCPEITEHNSSELNGNNKADNKKTERTTSNAGLSWQKDFLMDKELLVNAAYKVDIQ